MERGLQNGPVPPLPSPGGLLSSRGTSACCSLLLSKWSNSGITQLCRVSGSLGPVVSLLPLALGSETSSVHLEGFEATQKHLLRLLWACFPFCLPLVCVRSEGASRTEILQVTIFSFVLFNLISISISRVSWNRLMAEKGLQPGTEKGLPSWPQYITCACSLGTAQLLCNMKREERRNEYFDVKKKEKEKKSEKDF